MTPALALPLSAARKPQSEADLSVARRVLKVEAEAILALSEALDDRFAAAVDLLMTVRGRVIVSGIGKSGHVGRKIAATLASTGTPAQFVHPAEASHGDLGMVTAEDVALILSNSGETKELVDLLSHAGRWRIPIVAITAREESTLARAAAVPLILPKAPEACPMGLAPTTSTTMTLALGDALAVALMERRAFNPDRFRMLHPGGTLGAALLRVEDLMRAGESLPLISVDAEMEEQYRAHLAAVKPWLARQPHREVLYVDYNKMMSEPGPLCKRLVQFLGMSLDEHLLCAHALDDLAPVGPRLLAQAELFSQ